MAYGKLAVIKTFGEKPTFVILDKDENVLTTVPDFNDWMLKRIGKIVDVFISDTNFHLTEGGYVY
jgi:hypothetical protein